MTLEPKQTQHRYCRYSCWSFCCFSCYFRSCYLRLHTVHSKKKKKLQTATLDSGAYQSCLSVCFSVFPAFVHACILSFFLDFLGRMTVFFLAFFLSVCLFISLHSWESISLLSFMSSCMFSLRYLAPAAQLCRSRCCIDHLVHSLRWFSRSF